MFQCENNTSILAEFQSTIPTKEKLLTIIQYMVNDAMLKAAELTNQIKINQDRLDIMKSLQFISATKFASKEKQQQIKNVIQMNSSLFNSGIEQGRIKGKSEGIEIGMERGIEKGRFEGIEEGTFLIAKRMLKDNSPIEKIMEYTRLSKKEIESIKK